MYDICNNINVVSVGLIQIIFNTIISVILTYLYFKEPLSTKQIVGIFFGMISIYLVR